MCWRSDHMKLLVDMASRRNEDKSNITRLVWTESNKDPMTRLYLPFWEFTILLKRGIQEIDRKSPDVNIFKLVMGKVSSSEEISARYVLSMGHVIVNIDVINSIHLPQVWTDAIFPVKRQVKHHVTGHLRDRTDQQFNCTILIMRVHATIANTLVMQKMCWIYFLNWRHHYQQYTYGLFRSKKLWTQKFKLMLRINISSHMINKYAYS